VQQSLLFAAPQNQSDALRVKGNELFKAHKYAEAIEAYTSAIECCPLDVVNDSKAVYYQNRAAAYERMVGFAQTQSKNLHTTGKLRKSCRRLHICSIAESEIC
jgi:tetratricopeptide (TPR) repeat protein